MKNSYIFTTSIDVNNRINLPKELSSQIIRTLKEEDESEEIKRAVNLLPIQAGQSKGIFLISYIHYIRHFHRIIAKIPFVFQQKYLSGKVISEDIDGKDRVYLKEELIRHANLAAVRGGIVSKSNKVIIVRSVCGWTIWSEANWDKIKGRILILYLFRKCENVYAKINEQCCFSRRKGGLKKAISSLLLPKEQKADNPDFLIIEESPKTYILPCGMDLYERICGRPQDKYGGTMFSKIDYRCSVPMVFRLNQFDSSKIEIRFRRLDAFFDFLCDQIPDCQMKGDLKANFVKEGEVYVLQNISKIR